MCYKLDPSITFCGVGVAASYDLQCTGSTYKQRQIQRTAGSWDKCSTESNLSQDHLLAAPKTYVRAFYEFGTTTSCSSADGDDSGHEPTVVRPTDADSSGTTHQQSINCVPKLLIFLCFTFKVISELLQSRL